MIPFTVISRVPYRIGIFRSVSVSIFRYLQIPYRRQNRSVCRIVRNYDKVRNMIKLKIKGPFWDATKWFSVILRPPFLALKSFPPFCLAEEILTEYWPARHQYLPILARLPVPLVVGYSSFFHLETGVRTPSFSGYDLGVRNSDIVLTWRQALRLLNLKQHIDFLAGRKNGRKTGSFFFEVIF